jgi:hypothetical protein
MKLKSKKPPMKPEVVKQLRDKLHAMIRAGVEVELEKRHVTPSSFLSVTVDKTRQTREFGGLSTPVARAFAAFRKQLVHDGQWQAVYESFARERYAQLFRAQMKKEERRAARYQPEGTEYFAFDYTGFEQLRRMHVDWDTVEDHLLKTDRYSARANKNLLRAQQMNRLAEIIKDQPLDIGVPEAYARATAAIAAPAAAR